MSTVLDLNLCPICKRSEFELNIYGRAWLYRGIEYRLKKCRNCGLVLASPLPDLNIIKILYKEDYDYSWFEKRKVLKKLQAYHRVFRIRRYVSPNSKVLDIGCGHGYFVDALRKFGYEGFGFDFALSGNLSGNKYCFYREDLGDLEVENFDAVTMWHVLEHSINPVDLLNKIFKKLHDSGLIFISIPNYKSLWQRLRRDKWVWLQQPYVHIYHFNPKNIKLLVKASGFHVEKVWTADRWDASIYHVGMNSILNKARIFCNKWVLFDKILSLFGAIGSYLINPVHCIFGTGSEITLIARKKILHKSNPNI